MPLFFKQSSPLISEGYSAQKSMTGDAPVYLPTLIWLLIVNNFTDTNKAKCQDSGSANLSQEFLGKAHVALPKCLILHHPQNANCSALQVNRYIFFFLP